jgi:hypothetical protein
VSADRRDGTVERADAGTSGFRRVLGFVIGAALLGLAAWIIHRQWGDLAHAWQRAGRAPVWLMVFAVLLPMINWLLTSGVLLTLTRRFGRVPSGEMHAMVGAAWLLNYLPLKPGLFGRVLLHKLRHNIAVTDSIKVLVHAVVCGLVAAVVSGLLMVLIVKATSSVSGGEARAEGLVLGAVVLLVPAVLAYVQTVRAPSDGGGASEPEVFLLATMMRCGDLAIWSLRFACAFWVLGIPLDATKIVVIASATQIASLLPIQIGLAEWAAGLMLALLVGKSEPVIMGGSEYSREALLALGLSAGLLNRAAELVGALAVGGFSLLKMRAWKHSGQTAPAS